MGLEVQMVPLVCWVILDDIGLHNGLVASSDGRHLCPTVALGRLPALADDIPLRPIWAMGSIEPRRPIWAVGSIYPRCPIWAKSCIWKTGTWRWKIRESGYLSCCSSLPGNAVN